MKLRIYQAYYRQEQEALLDGLFTPYNNCNSTQHEYREYPIFKGIQSLSLNDDIDVWGYFSWKYQDKMPGLTGQDILEHIQANPGHDVYFWNPYSNFAVTSYNVWEQGQHFHTNLIQIAESLFPLIDIDSRWIYQPMPSDIIYYGLYCVGNRKFWNGFLDLADRYYNSIGLLPDNILQLHNSSAGYPGFPDLGYFPFIHERLLSTYLAVHYSDLKIWSYHHNYQQYNEHWLHLNYLKNLLITTCDPIFLFQYFTLRRHVQCPITYAEKWIEKLDSSMLAQYNNLLMS